MHRTRAFWVELLCRIAEPWQGWHPGWKRRRRTRQRKRCERVPLNAPARPLPTRCDRNLRTIATFPANPPHSRWWMHRSSHRGFSAHPRSCGKSRTNCRALRRCFSSPDTFDTDGWLTIGLCGHQPALAEAYISTGSLYLCTTAFLPLGLPESHPFWRDADQPYTAQRVWSDDHVPVDHALRDRPTAP